MKIGVQLYGVLADKKEDIFETLGELKKIGYSYIEPCVALEQVPGMEHVIWPAQWLLENLSKIDSLGLEVKSCHIFAQNPLAHLGLLKEFAGKGIEFFVFKSPAELTEESLQEAAFTLTSLADGLAETGAKILIHNEREDIETKICGNTAFEHLLNLCMGKVSAQADIGWIFAAGEDPAKFLWRNRERVLALHYKDFKKNPDGSLTQVPPGSGEVNSAACCQFARFMGIPQIVDQDSFPAGDKCDNLSKALHAVNGLNGGRTETVSYLNSLDVETGEVEVIKKYDGIIEAPNWLKKSDTIIYNANGRIYSLDLRSGEDKEIYTGQCNNCNNDHVVSWDETMLGISHTDFRKGFSSQVYTVPLCGGEPKLITLNSPSFLHGISPDGKELAYCAFRQVNGKLEVDVYAIPATGGEEKRLTCGGFNDGPEYSGEYIWYNSTKSGLMQIWRMKRDGTGQEQITFNGRNNWFAHISPDGKKVAYISYRKDELESHEHLPNMQVEIWLMNADGNDQHKVVSLIGGQGSLNVNSWAGDSRHLAFVSYDFKR